MKLTKQNLSRALPWVLSIFISFIFVQSLFFKFSNAPETQHIFGTLDQWTTDSFGISGLFLPPGIFNQYVVGSGELIASVLLILGLVTPFKKLNLLGALVAFGVISGAIFFHLFTPLGVNVQGDGGALFGTAVGIWFSAAILLYRGRGALCGLMGKSCPHSS